MSSELRDFFEGRWGCDLSKLSDAQFVLLVKQRLIENDEAVSDMRRRLLALESQTKGIRAFKATMYKALSDLIGIAEPSSTGKIMVGLRNGDAERPEPGETEYHSTAPWPTSDDLRDKRQIEIADERARKVAV